MDYNEEETVLMSKGDKLVSKSYELVNKANVLWDKANDLRTQRLKKVSIYLVNRFKKGQKN
jgi:hypothetical protein